MNRMSDKKIKRAEREVKHFGKTIPSVGSLYKAKIIRSRRLNQYQRNLQNSLKHLDGKHLLFLEWSEKPREEDRRSKIEGLRFLILDDSDYVWMEAWDYNRENLIELTFVS